MPLPLFEGACVAIILLALWALGRLHPLAQLLPDYLTLAVGAWLGEQSCIVLYGYYHYAAGWHGRLGEVPLLVPLIWPLVILSARDVAGSLWPDPRGGALGRALLVGLVVTLDASLVEVLAVRAGLWRWVEGGHLEVPLIGIIGWGYFAAAASYCLALRSRWRRLWLLLVAPLATHAAIELSWWSLFRWWLRGPLGAASLYAVAGLGVLLLGLAVARRQQGRAIELGVALPRAVAGLLFLLLLVSSAADSLPLWLHTAAVAIPYCVATRWSLRPAAATASI